MIASDKELATGSLALRGITKSFPGVRAVDNVSLDFYPGKIHALMGENGAGKSTVMKIITGIYQPDSGEMSFNGKRLAPRSYRESLAMGIDIVHQEIQVVPDASVAENIMLDKLSLVSPGGRVNWRRLYEEASVFMREVGLNLPPSTVVRQLSAAHKQLIQIARALAARATVILLDEPTSSLSLNEADNLFKLLDGLKKRDVTLIYVSHKIEEVYRIADTISVMRDGKLIGTRTSTELERRELVRMMIGRDLREQRIGPTEVNERRVVLKVDALNKARKCRAISFELHEGEILGFYGLVGAGRTEFARVLIGEDQADSGSVYVNGKKAAINRVSDALFRYKIGYVTENRKEEGLFPGRVRTDQSYAARLEENASPSDTLHQQKERGGGRRENGLRAFRAHTQSCRSGGESQRRQPAKDQHRKMVVGRLRYPDHRRTDRGSRRRRQRADPSVDLEPGATGAESDYPYLLRDGGNHPAVQPDPDFCRSTDYW